MYDTTMTKVQLLEFSRRWLISVLFVSQSGFVYHHLASDKSKTPDTELLTCSS
jgi:hypothetical protein